MFVLELPNSVCFPCLKILWLKRVVYGDDSSAKNLFSSYPVLEDLAIRRRGWDGMQTMNISTPLLKGLSIHSIDYPCKTVISAPCLEYLEHASKFCDDYSANFISSLVEARLFGEFDFGLLNGISGVQSLTLFHEYMWCVDNIIDDHDIHIPMFRNLKKLELYIGLPLHWEVLPKLLGCSPNLEVLVFPKGVVAPRTNGRSYKVSLLASSNFFYRNQPGLVAECLKMNHKTVEIFNFVGLQWEMRLVAYLLKHGQVLEKMITHGYDCSGRPDMREKKERD